MKLPCASRVFRDPFEDEAKKEAGELIAKGGRPPSGIQEDDELGWFFSFHVLRGFPDPSSGFCEVVKMTLTFAAPSLGDRILTCLALVGRNVFASCILPDFVANLRVWLPKLLSGVFVDETACSRCYKCVEVASSTFAVHRLGGSLLGVSFF